MKFSEIALLNMRTVLELKGIELLILAVQLCKVGPFRVHIQQVELRKFTLTSSLTIHNLATATTLRAYECRIFLGSTIPGKPSMGMD